MDRFMRLLIIVGCCILRVSGLVVMSCGVLTPFRFLNETYHDASIGFALVTVLASLSTILFGRVIMVYAKDTLESVR